MKQHLKTLFVSSLFDAYTLREKVAVVPDRIRHGVNRLFSSMGVVAGDFSRCNSVYCSSTLKNEQIISIGFHLTRVIGRLR